MTPSAQRRVVEAAGVPVIAAGSIDRETRVKTMIHANTCGFLRLHRYRRPDGVREPK
jgi:hypothetical protein